ncbi:DUF535 family protein [Agrobacterium rhizogenes]|uniref:DUF535 family protein n=1 Tax=Rhizobium rhizogenes TaxID=359 RepID=UPI0022B741CD|nr:DUF535 family protein [Rhizobium rhizogenes]MCZ7447445.1 DUF535 family protein [Rhizobium rhizogenes]
MMSPSENAIFQTDASPENADPAFLFPQTTLAGDGRPPPRFFLGRSIAAFMFRTHWKRGFLLWMRFAAHPFLTLRWWRFLCRFSAAEQLPPPHDDLLQKPFSKFLVAKLSYANRLELLRENFRLASHCFAKDVLAAVWAGGTVETGVVHGRSDEYRCSLGLADRCGGRHEGALAIRLSRCNDEAILWTAKFLFVTKGGRRTIVVGGMQGPRAAKQEMVTVTRDLFGLRPKEAVLMAMQAFLDSGAGRYLAVSQARHPINCRRSRRQKMLFSDIDSFWSERSAEPDDIFGFEVPISGMDGTDKRSRMKAAFFRAAAGLCHSGRSDQRSST